MPKENVHILLVEDDEVDAEAIVRAFARQRIDNPFTIVSDGIEAFNVLRGESGRNPVSWPYLILLDLNMPRMNGIEFLHILRQDPILKRSVVFVLTTSNRDEDKIAAYDKQVAGYMVKSGEEQNFINIVSLLESYWHAVEFPPGGR
jgi:CheY-like chemotaxis protein